MENVTVRINNLLKDAINEQPESMVDLMILHLDLINQRYCNNNRSVQQTLASLLELMHFRMDLEKVLMGREKEIK